jgi:hypothetical protein
MNSKKLNFTFRVSATLSTMASKRQNNSSKWAGGVAQVVGHLLSKHKALSPNKEMILKPIIISYRNDKTTEEIYAP